MKILIRFVIITCGVFSLGSGSTIYSQNPVNKLNTPSNLKFSDGVYFDFDQVKANSPVPANRIVSSTDYHDRDFYKKLMTKKSIGYYDDAGTLRNMERDSIWGFSDGGIMNVQVQGKFYPITTVGRICHFSADIESKELTYNYGPDRLYMPHNMYPIDPNAIYDPLARIYYFPYGSMYPPSPKEVTRSELIQFLLDFDTGEAIEFDPESTGSLIMKDEQLYKEYNRLSLNKKRELMFVYIKRFNEKNPLILPERKQ
jgi:hypothetical protein